MRRKGWKSLDPIVVLAIVVVAGVFISGFSVELLQAAPNPIK